MGMLGSLWTFAVLGAPTLLHPCPMHAAGHAAHETAAVAPIAAHDHEGHGAAAVGSAAETDEQEPASPCQCLDCCCTTSPVTVSIDATIHVVASITPAEPDSRSTADPAPPRALAHRLPFANGPPALNS